MTDITAIRAKYPQYKDIPDQKLVDALYDKHYSGRMERNDFYGKIGFSGGAGGVQADTRTTAGPINDAKPDTPQMSKTVEDSLMGDWRKRQGIVDETKAARGRGEMGGITALTTPVGQAAGFGMDVLSRTASAVIPEFVKEGAASVGKAAGNIPTLGNVMGKSDRTLGDVVGAGAGAAQEAFGAVERASPTTGRVLRDTANVGLLTGPIKGKKVPVGGDPNKTLVGKGADIIATGKTREAGIREMVKRTGAKADKEAVPYTEVKGAGPFKRKVTTSSDYMKQVEKEVSNIPGVNPRDGYQKTYNKIQAVVNKDRADIEGKLDAAKAIIPKNEVKGLVAKASDDALSNPIFKGESTATNAAQSMIDQFDVILQKHPGTARGLHDARMEFDSVMKDFYPNIDNYQTASNVKKIVKKAIRDETNKNIDRLAPDAGYKAYRDKSSRLLTAMGNMTPGAAKEVVGITKSIQNILKPSGIPYVAPAITAGAMLSKGALVKTLDAVDAGLRTIKDPKSLAQLRADKVALVAAMESMDEKDGAEAP